MKLKMYFIPFRWLAALLSSFTMVFSPLAMGKEAEKISKTALEKYIVEFGLDKSITLGEFWDKSKAFIPGQAYAELESFVKQNRNLKLPEVVLDQSKSTGGFDIPVIRMSANGRTQTLQFFGENKKWVRYNGVTLSAKDLERMQDAFARIEASDVKLKKQADQYRKNQLLKQNSARAGFSALKKDFDRFRGFPRMTPQLWSAMSKFERAAFLTRMRLLWNNARHIIDLAPQAAVKAPAKKSESAIQNFYKVIFGQPAEAAANNPYTASNCVVAGYIGVYTGNITNVNGRNRAGCSVDAAIAAYDSKPDLQFVTAANDACRRSASNLVACNPIIYGYPAGQEACISRTSREFQHGTHFDSPAGKDTCDGKSRLSSSPSIMAFPGRDYSGIQPRTKQIEAIEADQKTEDYRFTKEFLDGVLKKKGSSLEAVLQGEWNAGFDSELVRIQNQFEAEIETAIGICERSVVEGTNESNQRLACDQLHRRWLFTERSIAKFRDKACVKPAVYVGLYDNGQNSYADSAREKTAQNKMNITAEGANLCACPTGEKINFGATCPSVPPAETAVTEPPCPTAPTPSAPAPPEPSGSEPAPPVVAEPSCPPPVAAACDKPPGIANFNYENCSCNDGKKLEQKNGNYVCEGKKNNWLPWVLGGGALILLFALFHRHKKPKPPPPVVVPGQCPSGKTGTPPQCVCSNTCPAGSVINPESCSCSVVPEPPLCTAPLVGNPPNCACPSAPSYCTPPQKMYDMSTCQCTDVVQPVVCPNGLSAPNGNLALCNKCPSGAYEPVGGCPNEGGGGNNCPQGGCSGGLPGTGN